MNFQRELALGTKVELEHTDSVVEARQIALAHLRRHPNYYSRMSSAGLGISFGQQVGKEVIGGTVGTRSKDVPAPMDLYNEAAPRIVRGLRQYDAAAPGIDWLTANWPVAIGAAVLIAVGGSYLGNLIYHKIHKR
jgi:hypothetical protein